MISMRQMMKGKLPSLLSINDYFGSHTGVLNFVKALVLTLTILLSLVITNPTGILPDSHNTFAAGYGTSEPISAPAPVVVDVSNATTPQGVFKQDFVTKISETRPTVPNRETTLTIPKDTKAVTREGTPPSQLTITQTTAPAPPTGSNMIGLPFNFGPDGLTFDKPVTITVKYDPALLPSGTDPNNLVIAFWDTTANKWTELPSRVDTATGTLTAEVTHFTVFALITRATAAQTGVTLSIPSLSPWAIAVIIAVVVILMFVIYVLWQRRRYD